MKTPLDLGFRANPFPQHGVPPNEDIPFITYPNSDLSENALEKLLKGLYNENRPACYIIVGEYGSGKSHLSKVIRKVAARIGYSIKEETFGTATSLYDAILKTDYKNKQTLILFDEIQGLYEKVERNPLILSEFKIQLRNFLEGKRGSQTEEGFANVKIFLFCTPQIKDTLLHEEDMIQRFMLTVKKLPALEPFIGLKVTKVFLKTYAEKWLAETKLKTNPYYPFDRYTVLSLINLCPYVVERKGGRYRPTTRFLVELLRHCFDHMLESNWEKFSFKELPSALKNTKILEMTINLSPNTYKLEEIAKTHQGKAVAQFLGTALGWWTLQEISKACGISFSEAERVLQDELSSVVNAEKSWIVSYETAEENIKSVIESLGERYREKIEEIFSIPWVTVDDEPCYLVIPSIHLIDDQIEDIFKRFNVKQQDIYWLKNSFEIFGVSLEGKFRKFSVEQIRILREFLNSDSISREQKIFGQLKTAVTHASIKEQSIIEPEDDYGDPLYKIVGIKVTPHTSTNLIYYRVGLKFLNAIPRGIVEDEFRRLIERLKTSTCDFVIVFVYPELLEHKRLKLYMNEKIRWAPASKRIFIKNLTEIDLVNLLTNPGGFVSTLEDLVLSTIRNFNEGMLKEYLLMPFRGLKWAMNRLKPGHEACIFPKLEKKWFKQVCDSINNSAVRNFIYENFRHPESVTFEEGELIRELFDEKGRLVISEYERKVYPLLENLYQIEESELEEELNKAFVSGALYKLKEAKLTPYQFILKNLLATKNLVKFSQEYDSNGQLHVKLAPRKISEEKYSVLSLIENVRRGLEKEDKIVFDNEVYIFSNRKYISNQLDKLQLIEEYINDISDPVDLYKRAVFLSQLHYITNALQNLWSKPQDEFLNIVQKIRELTELVEKTEEEVITELKNHSLDLTPQSCITVKGNIKDHLSKISKYVEEGRYPDLIKNEVAKLENIAKSFEEESKQIVEMIKDVREKIFENNKKSENIIAKKARASEILQKIADYRLDEYLETTPISLEKNFFDRLCSFLKTMDSMEIPLKIEEGKGDELIKSLENLEFSQVLEKYYREVQSVLNKTNEIDAAYSSLSNEFISESQSILSALETFWQSRLKDIEEYLYELKNTTDGILRAIGLVNFYHRIISKVGITGTKIANAIACDFLGSFLFLDQIQEYSEKMNMSAQEFKEGIENLKKTRILKEGVG